MSHDGFISYTMACDKLIRNHTVAYSSHMHRIQDVKDILYIRAIEDFVIQQ